MPSKSPEQAKLMRAVAHGWKKSGGGGPSRAVATEFMNADQRKMYSGGFAENRYAGGGPVHMGMGGLLQEALRQLPEGHELRIRFGIDPPGEATLVGRDRNQPAGGLPTDGDDRLGGPPPVYTPPRIAGGAPPRPTPNRESSYRSKLRAHRSRVADILGSKKRTKSGGKGQEQPVKMQEGGAVRPGHAEGPNPHDPAKRPAAYALWEHKNHIEPPPPPPPEEPGFLESWFGIGAEEDRQSRTERELAALGEAEGGYIDGYARGGLSQFAGRGRPGGFMGGRNAGPIKRGMMGRGAPPPMQDPRARRGAPLPQRGQPRGGMMGRGAPPPRRGAPPPGRGGVFGGLAQAAGAQPGRGGMFNRAMQQMQRQQQAGGGYGRPGRMPLPGGRGAGGPPGGARTPPNMRGMFQRMQMQNRPTMGGGNRVGQSDQQGALSRALQRGTGRPPMSRRSGFPGRR